MNVDNNADAIICSPIVCLFREHMQGSSAFGICGIQALEDAFKSLPNAPQVDLFDSTILIDIRK